MSENPSPGIKSGTPLVTINSDDLESQMRSEKLQNGWGVAEVGTSGTNQGSTARKVEKRSLPLRAGCGRGSVVQCAKIKADRVVGEEVFTVYDIEKEIIIRRPLAENSKIDPQKTKVKVSVLACDLQVDQADNIFLVDLKLFIDKQIYILQNGNSVLGSALSLNKAYPGLDFKTLRPSQVQPELYPRLRCQVYQLKASEELALNPVSNTFNEKLTVKVTIKIVYEDQISVALCPEHPVPVPPIPCQSPIKISALDILEGKIRNQIGNHCFKEQLLRQICKVRCLLRAGRGFEALVILNTIANELQQKINCSPSQKISINLVLTDLIEVEKELKQVI